MGPCGRGWCGVPCDGTGGACFNDQTECSDQPMAPNPLPAYTRESCVWYTSHYCEENTLRLCNHLLSPAETAGVELYVVFISNDIRQVPVWCQRLAERQNEPVLWDYHVLLLARHPHGNWIYDLDSTLSFPSQATTYMTLAFRRGQVAVDERFQQFFRVVPARECSNYFASDRSHMLGRGGVYSAQPPGYAPLRGPLASSSHNMEEWIRMDPTSGRGHVMTLPEMDNFVRSVPYRYS